MDRSPSVPPKPETIHSVSSLLSRGKLAIVMVGLPARGKTFIARKLARYLSWRGHKTKVFNLGAYRRERVGAGQDHTFFDPRNESGNEVRLGLAIAALSDMLGWLRSGGEIGIYDATDSTRERRTLVRERCELAGVEVVFVESVCNDPSIIETNVRENKASSPDYTGIGEQDAIVDFRRRIEHYASTYESVGEDEGSFIRTIDAGKTVVAHRTQGYLTGRLVFFLLNMNIRPKAIWITRHGETAYNIEGRIGGDPPLCPSGQAYAESLGAFVRNELVDAPVVWTSTLRRTMQTADRLMLPFRAWRMLDEIDAGVCDGMTYSEVATQMPSEFAARANDKFRYRYPRGESYQDIIQRLEPVIFELERERSQVLIVTHQAVGRALYAYMVDQPPESCPFIELPLHTLIQLNPTAYGIAEKRFLLAPTPAPSVADLSHALDR